MLLLQCNRKSTLASNITKNHIIHLKKQVMMDFITAPLVVGIITLGIYRFFELFVRRKERMAIIEKYGVAPGTENHIFSSTYGNGFGALKIACLMLGVGLGLLVGFFIGLFWNNHHITAGDQWHIRETLGIVYGASVLLCGGLGLLIAFFVEQKYAQKEL
jgi:hypothetical protein